MKMSAGSCRRENEKTKNQAIIERKWMSDNQRGSELTFSEDKPYINRLINLLNVLIII